jgi:hypothetical protein
LIYAHLGFYQEILKMSEGQQIPEICRAYGSKDLDLWRLAIIKLAEAKDEENLRVLFGYMTQSPTIPFLTVLKICKAYRFINLGILKPLAISEFSRRQGLLKSLQETCEAAEKDIVAKEDLVVDLTTKHFIVKAIRCDGCHAAIDLPAQHFLCKHSFHMACLGDDLTKCPICKEKQEGTVQDKVASFMAAQQLLEESKDPSDNYGYKLLEHVTGGTWNSEQNSEGDTFSRFSACLRGDLLNPDDGGAKLSAAESLLQEYVGPVETVRSV